MSNRDDPNSNNKNQLRVMDEMQMQSVSRSLRDSTNGMCILDSIDVLAIGGVEQEGGGVDRPLSLIKLSNDCEPHTSFVA